MSVSREPSLSQVPREPLPLGDDHTSNVFESSCQREASRCAFPPPSSFWMMLAMLSNALSNAPSRQEGRGEFTLDDEDGNIPPQKALGSSSWIERVSCSWGSFADPCLERAADAEVVMDVDVEALLSSASPG